MRPPGFKAYNEPMSELRWILLALGVVILGVMYYFGSRPKPKKTEKRTGSRKSEGDPTPAEMSRELEALGQLIADQRGGDPMAAKDTAPKPEGEPPAPVREHDKIVTLLIKAAPGHQISGLALKDAADKAGLEYGAMGIFHRMHDGSDGREPLLSLANLFQPGTLDLTRPDLFQTEGLALFLTLPAPISALDAWDALLATGQRLAGLLNANLLDDGHCELSRQRLAHLREEMREYDRRRELVP